LPSSIAPLNFLTVWGYMSIEQSSLLFSIMKSKIGLGRQQLRRMT